MDRILLGPTDLLESNEDVTFCISVLSVVGKKGETLYIFSRKPQKCLFEREMLSLVLLVIQEKYILKTFEIAILLEILILSTDVLLGYRYKYF